MDREIKVADEVWIATALLHKEQPDRDSFAISEIVDRVYNEGISETLRPGVQVHASSHCVANKRPNPSNHRMLYETRRGERRLYRNGDDFHPYREAGKTTPDRGDIPPEYRKLLDWYETKYNDNKEST